MSYEVAVRVTEMLMGWAFALQCLEYWHTQPALRGWCAMRLLLAVALIIGWHSLWILAALLLISLVLLRFFQGPYNGGSDRLGLLMQCMLLLVHALPVARWRELAFGYLAAQVMLSYFIAGWVKLKNPEWRSGRALRDVFEFSAYPVSESLREWARAPRRLQWASWAVFGFELLFPLALLNTRTLYVALLIAGSFHLANACLFGLNRFFWIWVAAYPSLLWLQQRIVG